MNKARRIAETVNAIEAIDGMNVDNIEDDKILSRTVAVLETYLEIDTGEPANITIHTTGG